MTRGLKWRPKCPACGRPMRRIRNGWYECTNPKCYVIEINIGYSARRGFHIKRVKVDTILYKKALERGEKDWVKEIEIKRYAR